MGKDMEGRVAILTLVFLSFLGPNAEGGSRRLEVTEAVVTDWGRNDRVGLS